MISAELLDSKRVTESQYGRHITQATMKTALTPQQIAAAQAGITPVIGDAASETKPVETTAETKPAEIVAETLAETKPAVPDQSGLVALLQTQLDASNKTNIDLRVELAQANSSVQSLTASQAGLKQIVAGSLSTMRVALSLSKVDMSAMAADALIAEHAAVCAQFSSTFKVGGVAVHSKTEETAKAATGLPKHLVEATRLPKNV
jgi:hypothetical protein